MNLGEIPDKIDVLVVDDHFAIVFSLTQILKGEGFAAIGVTDPEDARRCFASNPDFLIVDLSMLRVDGQQLATEAIRAVPGIRVFFHTGASNLDMPRIVQASGAEGWLPKPMDFDLLLTTLRSPRPDPRNSPDHS